MKLGKNTEFETKYLVAAHQLDEFKEKALALKPVNFVYTEGPDIYWTKGELFFRYRKAAFNIDGDKAWLTMKKKPQGAVNNIKRTETDVRVDKATMSSIEGMIELLGFKADFEIYKICHIYYYEDATLVFYGVRNSSGNRRNFLEIEVKESKVEHLTEEEAFAIIDRYEELLDMRGVEKEARISKSLFEMYTNTKRLENG